MRKKEQMLKIVLVLLSFVLLTGICGTLPFHTIKARAADGKEHSGQDTERVTVEYVEDLIDRIGTVDGSEECFDRIIDALLAYVSLTDEEAAGVSNEAILSAAITQYLNLTAKEPDYLDSLRTELSVAAEQAKSTGVAQTVNFKGNYALPLEFMRTLKENPLVTLNYEFPYRGIEWEVSVSAKNAVADDNIRWYGPAWLLQNYTEKVIGPAEE
ncbi:MAG: hypothetical protein K5879_05810 [Lachnospiraceae bacterium]|nr:hypothetical protein [Lachnospiraceae bacterium]